jgi:hypothetical protein
LRSRPDPSPFGRLNPPLSPGNASASVPDTIATALGRADKVVDLYWTNSPMFWMWTPMLRDMRRSDAFRERVRDSGMLAYWQKYGWPDKCRAVGDNDFACD